MSRNSEDISDNAEWQLREELTAGKAISDWKLQIQIADGNRAASADTLASEI
jgi:hypothetical protein